MNAAAVALPARARYARVIGFATWIALIALQVVWHGWLAPPSAGSTGLALAIAIIPLLLPALALRRPSRVLLLAGMIALFYFCHGVSQAFMVPDTRVFSAIEIALAVILIVACGFAFPKRAT